ncbi:Sperm-associated antigen 1 [Phytophthora citrophthora]|uniref:Sperm-associated antigen 1 n=1 Tax=Phytophthora citrophthora TaxID=4793 RepID=A0AAD9LCY5_9STRA|nr:Sperm-associated antigen 1 [Phytophthora citrophthora]
MCHEETRSLKPFETLTTMDPIKALDMENRSGISQQEVEDFASRMDMIAKAMEDVKNGTFDPLKCNIPGYKTPEQEELERKERIKRENERNKRLEEAKRKEKQEEHDNWWHKAELRYSLRDSEEDDENKDSNKSERWANRILAAYKSRDANDYSLWNQWVPEDPVSLQEKAEREAELEKLRNREFENNNPEFCNQFKKDMEERQRSQLEKANTAERLKLKGNRFYKKKQYDEAIKIYMEALTASPFSVAILANLAQCYLRLDLLDGCIEFCTRTLYVDDNHVKALSRRATAFHRQKKFKEAAEDMRKVFSLDGENADVVEQHSVIVGDYEDSITNSELDSALNRTDNPSTIEELRFSLQIFEKMNDQAAQEPQRRVKDSWVAYALVTPFMERNEHVRAKFRTSGEMDKLCERIEAALATTKAHSAAEVEILSGMINCSAAAVAENPRNQVVMFRNVNFREKILTVVGDLVAGKTPWMVQASLVRFLEAVVESKSWRNAMLSSDNVLSSLLAALCLQFEDKTEDRSWIIATTLSASNICFTLSSESAGVQAFNRHSVDCIATIALALETAIGTDLLRNLLGFVINLSTNKTIRETIESNKCEETRRKLVQALLQTAKTTISKDATCSERALGALLNFSSPENSQLRCSDLVESGAVDVVEKILSMASPSTFSKSILVLSRAVGLLCRLHAAKGELFDRLTSSEVLSKLYAVCEYATSSFSSGLNAIPDEIWQLYAQISCHFGWCSHIMSVRGFLRDRKAVSLLIQVVATANAQDAFHRSSGETTACERLVGNSVKVLIALQSDLDGADLQTFRDKKSLSVLVKALQELPDGVARKNVAILLAKLCQADAQIKDGVRDLRGIEMMMSVGRSLKR